MARNTDARHNDATNTGKGHRADSPTDIPAPGWKDLLVRTFKQIGEDRVTMVAGAVTYFSLLALFPALSALVSVYGLFTDPSTVREHISLLSSVVPQGGLQLIDEQLQRLTSQPSGTLGFALVISLAIALWSASSGVKTMFEAMNIAYDEREHRNFFVLNGLALLFTLGGVVGVIVLLGVAVVLPPMLAAFNFGPGLEWLVQIGSYIILALGMLTGIAALYRWGPSRRQAKWRWITPGAIFAVLAIIVMSALFSWYAANFANYDKTYGSLGGLIGFLTWMWLSITALIIGAEFNAEAERQTARDTTVGADKPMGSRDAAAADTVVEGDDATSGSRRKRSSTANDNDLTSADERVHRGELSRPRGSSRPVSLGRAAIMLPVALAMEAMLSRRRHDG